MTRKDYIATGVQNVRELMAERGRLRAALLAAPDPLIYAGRTVSFESAWTKWYNGPRAEALRIEGKP